MGLSRQRCVLLCPQAEFSKSPRPPDQAVEVHLLLLAVDVLISHARFLSLRLVSAFLRFMP